MKDPQLQCPECKNAMEHDSKFVTIYKCNNKKCYIDTIVVSHKELGAQIDAAQNKFKYFNKYDVFKLASDMVKHPKATFNTPKLL